MVTRVAAGMPGARGEKGDVVSATVRELQEAWAGREWVEAEIATALLLFKRR
jgi:hypothetical protein